MTRAVYIEEINFQIPLQSKQEYNWKMSLEKEAVKMEGFYYVSFGNQARPIAACVVREHIQNWDTLDLNPP